MIPALAPISQSSEASARVVRGGARSDPERSADFACARQARASASVRKVFLIVFLSRAEKTWAW